MFERELNTIKLIATKNFVLINIDKIVCRELLDVTFSLISALSPSDPRLLLYSMIFVGKKLWSHFNLVSNLNSDKIIRSKKLGAAFRRFSSISSTITLH